MLERKKNGQIKGLISNMWLILCYTVQLVITKLCTKFQDPRSSSSCKIFDRKKVYTHTNTRTEKAKTIYPLYTSYTGGIKIKKNVGEGGGGAIFEPKTLSMCSKKKGKEKESKKKNIFFDRAGI